MTFRLRRCKIEVQIIKSGGPVGIEVTYPYVTTLQSRSGFFSDEGNERIIATKQRAKRKVSDSALVLDVVQEIGSRRCTRMLIRKINCEKRSVFQTSNISAGSFGTVSCTI